MSSAPSRGRRPVCRRHQGPRLGLHTRLARQDITLKPGDRLLRQHAGGKLADDALLALGEPVEP
jgi:hypothetical protein